MEALPEQGVVPVTRISDVTRDKDGIVVLAPEEPEHVTSLTPSGLEVYYSWAPKRHYKVRDTNAAPPGKSAETHPNEGWAEVPSVTSVLNVLDKSGALSWWAQGISAEGVLELVRRGHLAWVAA